MSIRAFHKFLWYFGWLVCAPALGWGIGTGNLALAGVALPALLASLYFSLRKLVCPKCGHAVRTAGSRLSHCMRCGATYTEVV